MFEHLGADERVERVLPVCGDVAVVHEVHANAALKTSFSDPLLRECLLLDRERECQPYDAGACVQELLVRTAAAMQSG